MPVSEKPGYGIVRAGRKRAAQYVYCFFRFSFHSNPSANARHIALLHQSSRNLALGFCRTNACNSAVRRKGQEAPPPPILSGHAENRAEIGRRWCQRTVNSRKNAAIKGDANCAQASTWRSNVCPKVTGTDQRVFEAASAPRLWARLPFRARAQVPVVWIYPGLTRVAATPVTPPRS